MNDPQCTLLGYHKRKFYYQSDGVREGPPSLTAMCSFYFMNLGFAIQMDRSKLMWGGRDRSPIIKWVCLSYKTGTDTKIPHRLLRDINPSTV